MRVVFLCPHTKISGGVKVIFKLAQGLKSKGAQVCVCTRRFNDRTLHWFGLPNFKIIEDANPTYHSLPECDVLVNYGDGDPFLPLRKTTKQVLLLQNFGVHDSQLEKTNMMFPYDGVVAVSSWLANIACSCGQKKIYIVSPGIDEIFVPSKYEKSKVPIVGTLHHSIAAKNVALFEETIKHLFYEKGFPVKPLFLSAKPVANVESFIKGNIHYSLIVNPPQIMLPSIYGHCTAWMSPAYREGFGLTTLEAMACGAPVITLRNFGLDDYLIHGENCMLVKTQKEAADAIVAISSVADVSSTLSKNGIALAAKFTWEKTINQFYYALQEILK